MPPPQSLELTLIRELSSGTFARLYLASARVQGQPERMIAVKLLREQFNDQPDLLARTADEARLLARLRHRNIVRVEDTATIEGQFALLMEFVDGVDCKQLVELRGGSKARTPTPGPGNALAALSARAAITIVAASAAALDAAHSQVPEGLERPLNVVHRDVKPQNIMVSATGDVKVLDFGAARFAEEVRAAQTREMRYGSLKYMSPERREGDRGDLPGDVYALGLVLIELLRGEWLPVLPLDGAEHDEALAVYVSTLPAGAMPNAEWEDAFHRLLQGMTASNPAWRPTCAEAAAFLATFLEHATGATIEEIAAENIAPVARTNELRPPQGELAGRRYVVTARAFEADPRTTSATPRMVARTVSTPSADPAPPAPTVSGTDATNQLPVQERPHPSVGERAAAAVKSLPPLAVTAAAEADSAFWTSAFARRLPGLPDDFVASQVGGDAEPAHPGAGIPLDAAVTRLDLDGPVTQLVQIHPGGLPLEAPRSDGPTVRRVHPADRSTLAHAVTIVSIPDSRANASSQAARSVPLGDMPTVARPAPSSSAGRLDAPTTYQRPPADVAPLPVEGPPEDDEAPPRSSMSWLARAAAIGFGATFAFAVLFLFIGIAVAFVYWDRLSGAASPSATVPSVTVPSPAPQTAPLGSAAPVRPGEPAPEGEQTAEAGGGSGAVAAEGTPPAANLATAVALGTPVQASVKVKSDSARWVRLQTTSGDNMGQGIDHCSAQVPPGDYRIVLSIVGRPVVSGTLALGGAAVEVECVPQPDLTAICTGVGEPVTLRP